MYVEFKLGRLICYRHIFIYLGNTEDTNVYCFGCHNCGYRLYTETLDELMMIKEAIDTAQERILLANQFIESESA